MLARAKSQNSRSLPPFSGLPCGTSSSENYLWYCLLTVLDVSGTVYRAPASEHIRGDWQLPDLFSHFAEYDNAPEGGRALTTLNIGDHGSGVPPHVHGEAWITAIYGAKKWFLYAPGNLGPPPQLALRRQNQMRE